jgi:hypothetical protein
MGSGQVDAVEILGLRDLAGDVEVAGKFTLRNAVMPLIFLWKQAAAPEITRPPVGTGVGFSPSACHPSAVVATP